jgi:hypothetical protein
MKRVLTAGIFLLVVGGSVHAEGWTDKVKIKGDLRYRHEVLDQDNDTVDARTRQRIRARISIEGQVNDETMVEIELASGSDDPVSTNQTLTDAFSTKRIGLNLAYLQYTPKRLPQLSVTAGKFDNPFFVPGKSELMWDSDWNPEGGVATYLRTVDNFTIGLVGSGLWIQERSTSDNSWIGAGQGMIRYHIDEEMKASAAVGAGYFNVANARGYEPFFDNEDSFGNSLDTDGNYATDFEIVEVFGEVSYSIGHVPVTVGGDFIKNTAADSLDTGWLVGAWIGKAKKTGSWELRYNYRRIERDAQVGIFTDSDFRGGGTNAKGHEFGGGYQLASNMTFGVTYFFNEIGLDQKEADFQRLQVDLQLKF